MRYLSDRVMVMYLGHVVEIGRGPTRSSARPITPITEAASVGRSHRRHQGAEKAHRSRGRHPLWRLNPPPGCPFQTRCRWKSEVPGNKCETEVPPMVTLAEGHQIKCHLSRDILERMEPVITIDAAQ